MSHEHRIGRMQAARRLVGAPHDFERIDAFEEHGQLWVTCLDCGAQWAVYGPEPADLEQVTDGDGWCAGRAESRAAVADAVEDEA